MASVLWSDLAEFVHKKVRKPKLMKLVHKPFASVSPGEALQCYTCMGSNNEDCNRQGSKSCPSYSDACAVVVGHDSESFSPKTIHVFVDVLFLVMCLFEVRCVGGA